MKEIIIKILKHFTKNQLISIILVLGAAYGGKIYIDKSEPKQNDNPATQIQINKLASIFYQYQKAQISKERSKDISNQKELEDLRSEYDAKIMLLADNLNEKESRRVKEMLEFAEKIKPKTDQVEVYTEEILIGPRLDTLSIVETDLSVIIPDTLVKDTLIKKSLFKKIVNLFNKQKK
jgi:hypothetical protein